MPSYTYDPATDAGRVRLLCTDTSVARSDLVIFSDEEVAAFLELEGGDVFRAAAQALETIAASEVLIQKRIKLLDLSTDGPAEADALRAIAAGLRERSAEVGDAGEWQIAEIVTTPAVAEEILVGSLDREEPYV